VLLHDERGVLRRVNDLETEAGTLVSTAPPPRGPRTDWPSTPAARLLFPEHSR
jgi:hypothetical protein